MRTRTLRTAKLTLVAMLVSTALFRPSPVRADTAEQILQKTRDTYVNLKSYADSGIVLEEFGRDSKDKHTFTTYFSRAPRHFLLQFKKSNGDLIVIWGDPDAFHTWWKSIGSQYDFPNPQNVPAFSSAGFNTKGASMAVPTLLYGKSQLGAMMLDIHDPALEATEEFAGHRCYRISGRGSDTYAATGKEVNIRRVTVWIDADSYLVRQFQWQSKALPGQINRTTFSYQPQANPTLDDSRFKFVPSEPK